MIPATAAATTKIKTPDILRHWRRDPVRMVRDLFRVEPDPWQCDVLTAFPESPRMALVACKGPGKTACLAWLAWNYLLTRPHPKIAAVAITATNLHDNLWAEMSKWQQQSLLLQRLFKWGSERITLNDSPETWFMAARSWDRDATPEQQGNTLAGIHADYVLFILDEGGGIPDAVAQKAEGGLSTGIEAHLIVAGNPTHLTGPLYRAATTDRQYWNVHSITGDPDDPNRASRVDRKWAEDMIARHGRNSSIVQVDVLGQFPTGATDALISRDWFMDAVTRWEHPNLATLPKSMGADIARFGSDRTVVVKRAGDRIAGTDDWQGNNTTYSTNRIIDHAEELDPEDAKSLPIMIDDIGVGGGVTDQLQDRGYNAIGVNVGSSPADSNRYINLRAELNAHMQDRFREGTIGVPPHVMDRTSLLSEATTLRIGYARGTNKKRIESKDEYKKRTGRSPDFWDAAVLAFYPGAFSPLVSV